MSEDLRPLPPFDYFAPRSLAEAVALLDRHRGAAKLLAGGTDLLPRMKKRKNAPSVLIDLKGIPELSFIRLEGDVLRIGGGTTFAEIRASGIVREKAEALADAVCVMASPGIRNRATLAGNLCNASRCADSPPPLLALNASVRLLGPGGERVVPLSEFFTVPAPGCGKMVAAADEVLTEVLIPCQTGRSAFLKLGRRKGSSTAIASAAAFAAITDGNFDEVRVAVGGIGSTPVRIGKIESHLRGAPARAQIIVKASKLIKQDISPLSDLRASGAYRKEMVPVLVKRVLMRIALGEERCE